MRLRSGVSYWQAVGKPPATFPELAVEIGCQVAVVGGGITGALAAHNLVKRGIDVVLIDKRQPAIGSTAASTGLLQYEVDTHLSDLVDKVGVERAVHAYRRGLRAIDELEEIIAELGDDCGYSRCESLYFASSWFHLRSMRREYACRREHGFEVQLLKRRELGKISSISASAALLSQGDAQVDPYRLTSALLARCQALGVRVFGETELLDIVVEAGSIRLRTATGSIRAAKVVFATGYETQKFLRQDIGTLNCTYAAVSQPINDFTGWPRGVLLWESARPYFYARQLDDGRAMIGGEDTMFASDHQRDALLDRKTQRLGRRFERLFPALRFEPQFAWAGTFGESQDGLPYIGTHPDQPDAYYAVCYGGNGITYGLIAARLIADLYCGRDNADRAVFGFDR